MHSWFQIYTLVLYLFFEIEKKILIFWKKTILIYNGSFQIIMVPDLIGIRFL